MECTLSILSLKPACPDCNQGLHSIFLMKNQSIDKDTQIGPGSVLGEYVVIESDVQIGSDCVIGHHVVLLRGTRIGNSVHIADHSVLGRQPMRAANSAVTDDAPLAGPTIGDRVRIGTHSIIYAGCCLAEDVFVADFASIREHVSIGQSTIVGRGVAIENRCSIGALCKLETNAYIAAYSEIGNRVFVAPGVLTSNDNFMGRTEERFRHFKGAILRDGSRLGVGAIVLPGVQLPQEAVLAAGALLTSDGEKGMVHKGLPARATRPVSPEQLLSKEDEGP